MPRRQQGKQQGKRPRPATKRDGPRARASKESPRGGAVPLARGTRRELDKALPAGPADTEAAIVESLADPGQRRLTVRERCRRLGIHYSTWYRCLADPLFKARASKAYRDCCADELAPVLDALVQSAKEIGREGHQDRKLLLELLGEYDAGTRGRGDVETQTKAGSRMSDEELVAAFADKPHLLPVGVLRRLGKDPDADADAGADADAETRNPKPETRKEAA